MKALNIVVVIIIVGLLFTYSNVEGANWTFFKASPDGTPYYYNADSVTYTSKDVVRFWTKSVGLQQLYAKNPETGKFEKTKRTREISNLEEIDCSAKLHRNINVEILYENGQSEEIKSSSSEWFNIKPNGHYELLYKALCP